MSHNIISKLLNFNFKIVALPKHPKVHFEASAGGLFYDLYFHLLRPIKPDTVRLAPAKHNHLTILAEKEKKEPCW